VLVTFFGDPTVYRYAIPAPSGAVALVLGFGSLATRRRRRAS